MMFKKATKAASRLRLGLCGTAGSGKSYSALRIAASLREGGKVAAIDTERGSLSKYADEFDFDVIELEQFAPEHFVDCIRAAERGGYDVLIIDSLTHAWSGIGGILDKVDNAAKRSNSRNSFTAWKEVTPQHNALVDAILRSSIDVIVTMRTKTEWVLEENERGKKEPRKVGMAPIQRDGMEYEFDVVGDMSAGTLVVSKSRCKALAERSFHHPGEDIALELRAWLTDGVTPPAEPTATPEPVSTAQLGDIDAEFGEVCKQYNVDPKTAAKAVIKKHNASGWSSLIDAQKRAAIKELHDEFGPLADHEGAPLWEKTA